MEQAARIAGVVLVLLGAATLLAYALQRTLIYYPSYARLEALESLAAREGLFPWRNADRSFIGWRTQEGRVFRSSSSTATPDMRFIAATSSPACERRESILRFTSSNIPATVPVQGRSDEENLVAAAIEAIDLLPRRIVLLGESLGSGVACQAAVREAQSPLRACAPHTF